MFKLIQNIHLYAPEDKGMNDLLICGEKIACIAPHIDIRGIEVEVIDGRGKFLMPGLIDAHWHAYLAANTMVDLLTAHASYTQLRAGEEAGKTLLRGFTTIRDAGGPVFGLKRAIDEGTLPGPRIYPSGAIISETGGHADFRMVYDIPEPFDCCGLTHTEKIGAAIIADGVDAVIVASRNNLRLGASQIKLMAGGGVSSLYDQLEDVQYFEDELHAAVMAAEDAGTYVMVHVYVPEAIRRAIRAGVKSIEHGQLIDEPTMKLIAEKGVWLSMQPFIVEVGEKVTDWKVGQRVVSDNSAHVCGVCPACEQGDFLCCESKVNLGLDNNTWGGGFSKYCKVPGEILRIHKHAIWEIPENVKYEEAAVLDPICNSYKAIAQQSHLLPGQDVVVFGTGPLGLFAVQVARIMGAVNIVMVGLDEDVPVRFPVAKELGATHCVNGSKEDVVKRCTEICGRDNLGLVVECSGANIALKQAIEMLRPNGEVVRVGMGFKPLEFSINDITSWNKSIIGHMAYDSTSWRNAIRLLASGQIKVQPMITHRLGLSEWEKGFELMAKKEAIKVIFTYDFDDED